MEKKSITENGLYNMMYKVLSVIFPLVTVTYTSRVLDPQGLGMVTYSQTIVSYFLILALMGIPNYGIREIANSKSGVNRNCIFSEILVINTVSTIMWSLLYLSFVVVFQRENFQLYLASGLLLVLNIFNVDWFFQGIEEYKFIALRSLVIKVFLVVCLFVLVREKDDYVTYSLVYSLAVAGNYLLSVTRLKNYTYFEKERLELRKHIKPIFALFAGTIANELYLHVDITMLGVLCDDSYVSYYSNPSKIMHVISNALIAFGAVIMPRLSAMLKQKSSMETKLLITTVLRTLMFISIPCSIGIYSVSKYMIPILFGRLYVQSITTMKILSMLIFLFAIDGGVIIPILIAYKEEKIYSLATIAGALINIVMNYVLISTLMHNGAAIASVISKFVMIIIELFYLYRLKLLPKEEKYLLKIIVMSALMFLSILAIDKSLIVNSGFLKMSIEIIIGVIVYLGCALMTQDETIEMIIKKMKKMRRTIK